MTKPRIADLVLVIDRLERQALWHEERKADAVAAEREAVVRYLKAGVRDWVARYGEGDIPRGAEFLNAYAEAVAHGSHHATTLASDSTTSSK